MINPLNGVDMVMSLTEELLNNILANNYGGPGCPSSYEAVGNAGDPWQIQQGTWSKSTLASMVSGGDWSYGINTVPGHGGLSPAPTIEITETTDINTGAGVTLTFPFASGSTFYAGQDSYDLSDTVLICTVPIVLKDITSEIDNSDPASNPPLATVKSKVDGGPFDILAMYLDFPNADTSDTANASTWPSGFTSDLQNALVSFMQALVGDSLFLGFIPIIEGENVTVVFPDGKEVFLNEDQYAFQAGSAKLSTTVSQNSSPLDKSMLNVCMMVTPLNPFPTTSGTGQFTDSLYLNAPVYSNQSTGDPGGLFFIHPQIFTYYMIQPYLSQLQTVFTQGHKDEGNGDFKGFQGFSYAPSFQSNEVNWSAHGSGSHGSKTYTVFGFNLGFGIKVEYTPNDPSATGAVQMLPQATEDSTYLIVQGSFQFDVDIQLHEEETALYEPTIADLTLSTTGQWQKQSGPELPNGTPATFSFQLGFNDTDDDTAAEDASDSAGELYMSPPQTTSAVLGFEGPPSIANKSTWDKIVGDILDIGTAGLNAIIEKYLQELASSPQAESSVIGLAETGMSDFLSSTFTQMKAASTSLQQPNLLIPDHDNYQIKDLNMSELNGSPVISCSINYTTVN